MNGIIDILIGKKKMFFFLSLLGLLSVMALLPIPEFTGSLNGFELADNEEFQNIRRLDSLFGSREKIYLQVTPNSDDRKVTFNAIKGISNDLILNIPGVEIASPLSFYIKMKRHWKVKDNLLSSYFKEAKEVPVLQQLIAKDRLSFLMVLTLENGNEPIVNSIEEVIETKHEGIKKIEPMSSYHVEDSIKKHIGRDILLLSGLILVFFLGFILLIFRNVLAVLFTVINVAISLFAAFVLFYFFNFKINIISILVIPITLILSMSDAMHLLSGYVKNGDIQDKKQRLNKVVSSFIIPSFFSSATTAVAFFSFYLFNDSQYIREFGLITSIALMLEFVLTFAMAPFLLNYFNIQKYYEKQILQVSSFLYTHRKIFSLGFVGIILLSVSLLGKMKFHTDSEMFFPLNSEIRRVHDSFKENYYSSIDLHVYVQLKDKSKERLGENSLYEFTKQLSEEFAGQEKVVNVNSATQSFYFKSLSGAPINLLGQLKNQNPYYNAKKNIYHIQVQFSEAQNIIELKNNGLNQILSNAPNNIKVDYSSKALLMEAVNESVAVSLIKSLFTSGIAIFLMMLILSKSLKTALFSLIPNVAPISFVVILYYVFGMHINILTAITAVICLGLLDDDTVHIIYRKLWLKEDMGELSFSILSSAILLSVGFFLFVFSSFEPIRVLGKVSAIIFLIGVICELTIMQLVLDTVKTKNDI